MVNEGHDTMIAVALDVYEIQPSSQKNRIRRYINEDLYKRP